MKEVQNQLEKDHKHPDKKTQIKNRIPWSLRIKEKSGKLSEGLAITSQDSANSEMTGLLDNIEPTQTPFFTEKAFLDMSLGKIPDFEPLYRLLTAISTYKGAPVSAIQFLPALRAFTLTDREEITNFLHNPETNHVLVQNDLIKIVLIRWEPGDECNIHGHAEKGCVFKVLQGKIVEKRYNTNDTSQQLAEGIYEKDNIAYIDDIMGLHKVCNPFDRPAITLHMYTPGNYKPRKNK